MLPRIMHIKEIKKVLKLSCKKINAKKRSNPAKDPHVPGAKGNKPMPKKVANK